MPVALLFFGFVLLPSLAHKTPYRVYFPDQYRACNNYHRLRVPLFLYLYYRCISLCVVRTYMTSPAFRTPANGAPGLFSLPVLRTTRLVLVYPTRTRLRTYNLPAGCFPTTGGLLLPLLQAAYDSISARWIARSTYLPTT